jgi:hypothetical protein
MQGNQMTDAFTIPNKDSTIIRASCEEVSKLRVRPSNLPNSPIMTENSEHSENKKAEFTHEVLEEA